MSIEKFLNNVETKDYQPGPFKARLKYELSQDIFKKNEIWKPLAIGSTSFATILLLSFLTIILKPDIAKDINYAITNKSKPSIEIQHKNNSRENLISTKENKKSQTNKNLINANINEQFSVKEVDFQPMISSTF